MSEQEKASGEDQSGGAANDSNSNVQTQEELKAELETLRKVKADLLSEKKAAQAKLSQFEKEKTAREEQELRAIGNFEALLKKEQEKSAQIFTKHKEFLSTHKVKDGLFKLGCTDEKKLSTLMKFKPVVDFLNNVKVTEDGDLEAESLNDFLLKTKEEFSEFGFFSKEAPSSKDVDPANAKEKDFSQMTPSEREAYKLKLLQGR